MKKVIVKDILKICDGELICGNINEECLNFCIDSRKVIKDDVYVGIKGENFDGNTFYENALEKGAKVCILQDVEISSNVLNKYTNATIIKVVDTIKAIQQIAKYKRQMYNIPVIAITGSSGKTSTKDIVASVVARKYDVLKTEGNYNNHIGLPLTILKLRNHTALVIEMGMNALGEIRLLSNIAKPNICVITNVGTSHIGKLGSRQNILKAKLEILEGMKNDGTLVINNDNDLLNEWNSSSTKYDVKTFGIDNTSDVMAHSIELKEYSSKFVLKGDEVSVDVPVGGKHFVYNGLCAITVGKILQIGINDIVKGIEVFELTKRRMDVSKNKNNVTIINDSYNANYDSMKVAIEYLSKMSAKKRVAVLGDMLELGDYSKGLHEKIGEDVVKNDVDVLVTVGCEAKYIAKRALDLGMKCEDVYEFCSTDEAIVLLESILVSDDVVLVKASNGMKFNRIVEALE